jgi:creatinine amidohydrolase
MIRELALNFPEVTVVAVNWYQVMNNQQYFDEPGDHAGEMETSLVMQLRPEWVLPLTDAGDGAERKFKIHGLKQGWAKTQRAWTIISEDTGVGNPSRSSAEKGNRFLQALQPELGRFLVEFAAASSIDDLYE